MKQAIVIILCVIATGFISGCNKNINPENARIGRPSFQEIPTDEQWQNVEAFSCFLVILETVFNGGSSGGDSYFYAPYQSQQGSAYDRYGYYGTRMR